MATAARPKKSVGSGDVDPSAPNETGELRTVRVELVDPSPYQPRKTFKQEDLDELAASMRTSGLGQPIVVRAVGTEHRERWELVAGERRLRAARQLGWELIPAIVRVMSDAEAATFAAVENLQRKSLTPLEESQAFKRLMREHGWSQQQLADRLGIPRSTVQMRLGLLAIGPWVPLLDAGEITVSQAVELYKYRQATEADHERVIAKLRRAAPSGIAGMHVDAFRRSVEALYGAAAPAPADVVEGDADETEGGEGEPSPATPDAAPTAADAPPVIGLFGAVLPCLAKRSVQLMISAGTAPGTVRVVAVLTAVGGAKGTLPAPLMVQATAEALDAELAAALRAHMGGPPLPAPAAKPAPRPDPAQIDLVDAATAAPDPLTDPDTREED